ncbi:MAG: (d)CMP kinase [Chloroflexota bacterium]
MPRPSTIAVDGPVASGKSTVSRMLAQRLGYRYVDTGMMYRAVTWKALRLDIGLEDEGELTRLAATTRMDVTADAVLVDVEDVTAELRGVEVEKGVSLVAKVKGVRDVLVEQQRELARGGNIVMAGRDIGTVVLPDADFKVYLLASLEERARRRYNDLVKQGQTADLQAVLADLRTRDEIDSGRAISPLQPAEDATLIDTDGLSIEEVLSRILRMVGE